MTAIPFALMSQPIAGMPLISTGWLWTYLSAARRSGRARSTNEGDEEEVTGAEYMESLPPDDIEYDPGASSDDPSDNFLFTLATSLRGG